MGWKVQSDMGYRKEWRNTKMERRIVLTKMGLVPNQAEWDVQVEGDNGKKGFKTKGAAMKFVQAKKKQYLY